MSSIKLQHLVHCYSRLGQRLASPSLQLKPRYFNSLATLHADRNPCLSHDSHGNLLINLRGTRPQTLGIQSNLITKRFKKSVKRPQASKQSGDNEEDDDDDDDDEDEDEDENPLLSDDVLQSDGSGPASRLTVETGSLRLDAFAKQAFSVSRVRVEEAFYRGELFVNGEKPPKKSIDVHLGDELDIVKGADPQDPGLIIVRRARVVRLPDKTDKMGRMKVDIIRWNALSIKPHGSEQEE